jgi:molybdopterin synthase sulfur carrier subunit
MKSVVDRVLISYLSEQAANLSLPLAHLTSHMLKINIPTPLRQYAGKQAAVEVNGGTVAEALNSLVTQHPELRRHLYTDDGKLRAFVNVYLNDEDIRYLQKEATQVKDSDSISIVPSIAGGSMENNLISESQADSMCFCPACCCR